DRFVQRFRYKKSKAKQAQAKLTQIGRLEKERRKVTNELELLTRRRRSLGFEFLDPPRSGRTVIEVNDLELAVGRDDGAPGDRDGQRGRGSALTARSPSGKHPP